jgi:hypothetical protein
VIRPDHRSWLCAHRNCPRRELKPWRACMEKTQLNFYEMVKAQTLTAEAAGAGFAAAAALARAVPRAGNQLRLSL